MNTARWQTSSRRWFLVVPENHLNMDEFFLQLLPRYFYACTQTIGRQTGHGLSISELLQKRIRACLSRTFFDGSYIEEKFREAPGRHTQCWKKDEVDPSVAAAGVKKALASQSEETALDRVEAAWSSLEEYFALNASIERVFRDSRGRSKTGPARLITVDLVAGLSPPEFKTMVATALDMKRAWKERLDLVYSVAREAAEAWTTVEQADKLCRVQSRSKGAVARVGSAKEEKTAVI